MKNFKSTLMILISVLYAIGVASYIENKAIPFGLILLLILTLCTYFKKLKLKYSIILLLSFVVGNLNMNLQTKDFDKLTGIRANDVSLVGQVVSIPKISNNNTRSKFYLDVEKSEIKGTKYSYKSAKTIVTINDEYHRFDKIQIGDTIKIKGNLRPVKSASNPYQFDYNKYLKYQDTFSALYCERFNYEILEKPNKISNPKDLWWHIIQGLDNKRNEIIEKHSKIVKSPELELLGGIVFGDDAINPTDEMKQSFINSGLSHITAASGLNVAIIFGIWWFLANFLKIPNTITIYSGMFFVVLYTFMTGFPPSILRASIMILFVLIGKLIDKESNTISLIFFVGLLMLLINPKMFCDVGFQLSFIVTIGLICTVEPIVLKFEKQNKKYLEKFKKSPRIIKLFSSMFSPVSIIGLILVPLVAQLYVAPLQMYYFNTLAPYSLFANLCILPFISIVSFLGFISSILSLISDKIIYLFDYAMLPFLTIIINISDYFSNIKDAVKNVGEISALTMFCYWGILIFLVENIKRDFKNKYFKIAILGLIVILSFSLIKIERKDFEIITFDVANADSFLIKTYDRKYILIDTGRKPYKGVSSAKSIIGEYLKNKNIKELELLIITHFDIDHSGGTVDILNDYKVKKIYTQNPHFEDETTKEILNLIKEKKVAHHIARDNEIIYQEKNLIVKTHCADFKIDDIGASKLDNENSIITEINAKETTALFMGDAGELAYNKISHNLDKVNILKVGHHGAQNSISKDMLEQLDPKYAIISVGHNIYGHPHPSTMWHLKNDTDIKILNTKLHGATQLSKCKKGTCTVKYYTL